MLISRIFLPYCNKIYIFYKFTNNKLHSFSDAIKSMGEAGIINKLLMKIGVLLQKIPVFYLNQMDLQMSIQQD